MKQRVQKHPLKPLSRRLLVAGIVSSSLLSGAVLSTAAYAETAVTQQSFNIDAGSLESALVQFSVQSGITVSFAPEVVQGMTTPQYKGSYAPDELLNRLLSDNGLRSEQLANGSYTIVKQSAAMATATSGSRNVNTVELDQMVITSTRAETQLEDSAQVLTVINRE